MWLRLCYQFFVCLYSLGRVELFFFVEDVNGLFFARVKLYGEHGCLCIYVFEFMYVYVRYVVLCLVLK